MLKNIIDANELLATRRAWGISQAEMGHHLGVTGVCVSNWERGAANCSGSSAILFQVLTADDGSAYQRIRDELLHRRMEVIQRRMRTKRSKSAPASASAA